MIRAAGAGKQVVALVELKARFDEEANITFARALEHAGVHVVYGVVGLKTHAKTCLVVRREETGIRRYAHIGTGNYNPKTARLYEDLGLLTSDPDLGADLTDLFNLLTGYSRQREYRKLLVAPVTMRPGLEELIRREAEHEDGSIVLKMNSLVDADLIDALYEASQAAARRSTCWCAGSAACARASPGLSEIDPRAIARGAVPGALAGLPVRQPRPRLRLPDRLGGPDAAQPRPPGRGAHARCRTPRCRRASTSSSPSSSTTTNWPGSSTPMAGGTGFPRVRGVNAHRALQELAVRRAPRGSR